LLLDVELGVLRIRVGLLTIANKQTFLLALPEFFLAAYRCLF
jgi:hypothetical protein